MDEAVSIRLINSSRQGNVELDEHGVVEKATISGGDDLVVHLKNFQKLRRLYFFGARITDQSIPIVASLESLEELDLEFPKADFSVESFERLAHLPNLRTFRCRIIHEPDRVIAAISRMAKLSRLSIPHTDLRGVNLDRLAYLPNLATLDVGYCQLSTAEIEALAKLAHLKDLRLDGGITDSDIKLLTKLRQLESITLRNLPITDAGLGSLKALSSLKRIILFRAEITSAGLVGLINLPLEELWLTRTNIDDRAIPYITKFRALRSVNLLGTKISKSGVKKLRRELPNCQFDSNFNIRD